MGLQGGLHEESYERIDKPNHTALSSCLRTRCLSDLLPAAPERRYCPEDRNESTGCFPIACTCTVLLGRPASPARACPPDGLVPDPQTHGDPQSRPPTASDKSTPEPHSRRPTLCVPDPQTHGDPQMRPPQPQTNQPPNRTATAQRSASPTRRPTETHKALTTAPGE